MKFSFKKPKENIANLARLLGYRLLNDTNNEFSLVRPLGGNYPRFHIYLVKAENLLNFNLHLDQKKPSYEGQTGHSGEYDGELVLEEKQRIEIIIASLLNELHETCDECL